MEFYNGVSDTLSSNNILLPNESICFSTIYNSTNGSIIGYRLSNIGVILSLNRILNPTINVNDIIKRLYTYRSVAELFKHTNYYIYTSNKSIEEISLFHILMPSQPTPPSS